MHDNNDAFWLERTERARSLLASATTARARNACADGGLDDLWDQWLRAETRRQGGYPAD